MFFTASDECNPVTGQCECPQGLKGFYCMETCSKGSFGQDCKNKCVCKKGDCHHVTGECRCPGGWEGEYCSEPCPTGKFGPNCAHDCYCHNGATCNPVDGKCKCKPGYYGNRCEEYCPEGYFGEDCYEACQCQSENYLCHPTLGCICQPRYGGSNCSTPISSIHVYPYTEAHDAGHSGVIFGVLFSIVLIVCAVVVVFLMKRYKNLKSKRANVHYIANSVTGNISCNSGFKCSHTLMVVLAFNTCLAFYPQFFFHISDLGLLGDQQHIYALPLLSHPQNSDYSYSPDEG